MKKVKDGGDDHHLVTARKWRPGIFGEIAGQTHIATTLRNAIASGRLSHAYLFSGPRGVGKTTTARILAKAINCLAPKNSDPDNCCEICIEISAGRSVNVFEIDGASNRGVDEIRNLREAVRYGPAKGRYKVYIIDEVHMLTKEAFNALLKTLEEPPPHIVFIFATTEVHKVPATILSRCQRFEFRRIATVDIVGNLSAIAKQEKIDIDAATLELIARQADGSLRDAQSIFDQVVSFREGTIRIDDVRSLLKVVDDDHYFSVTSAIAGRETAEGFRIVGNVVAAGYDLRVFIAGLTEHLRNLLVVRTTGKGDLVEGSEQLKKRYMETAKDFVEADLLRLLNISSETESAMRWSQQPRVRLELGLALMINMEGSVQIDKLLSGIEEMKQRLGGSPRTPGGTPHTTARTAGPAGASAQGPAPVRGAVKATQPTLRPDQYVAVPDAETASVLFRERNEDTTGPAGMKPSSKRSTGTGHDAAASWALLVERATKEKIGVGTMLAGTTFLSANGNNISVACPDDFHMDSLKRNRRYISELAESIYGARVQLETILGAGQGTGPAAAEGNRPGPDDLRNHPVVKAVISEFGAEVVD